MSVAQDLTALLLIAAWCLMWEYAIFCSTNLIILAYLWLFIFVVVVFKEYSDEFYAHASFKCLIICLVCLLKVDWWKFTHLSRTISYPAKLLSRNLPINIYIQTPQN